MDYAGIVKRQFEDYIQSHEPDFISDQLQFLRFVSRIPAQRGKLELINLYDSPFTNLGQNVVERLFSREQIDEFLGLAEQLSA